LQESNGPPQAGLFSRIFCLDFKEKQVQTVENYLEVHMQKTAFLAAILSLLFTQAICMAEANEPDANGFRNRPYRTRGRHQSERAVINWHDGIQQMVVSPRIAEDTNSIWLLPLKCKGENVKFRIATDFPQFNGADPRIIARNVLTNVNYALIATQLWTIPLCHIQPIYSYDTYNNFSRGMPGYIDSNGLRIELLKADSVQTLAQHLKDRSKSLSQTELESFAKYVNEEYTFLAVWREADEPNTTPIDNTQRIRRRPCIYVEFPCDKPFYPIAHKYGRQMRLALTLTGFWQIDGQERYSELMCNQLIGSDANVPDSFKPSLPQKNIPFTYISLNGRGDSVQNDLSFVPGRLKGMAYADALSKMSYLELILFGLIGLACISYLSAGISGLLIYKKWRGFAEFGFLNLLSILALSIAMNYQKGGMGEIFRQDKWKARRFLAFFSLLLALLSVVLFTLLKIPLK
jgi:hypothetical protein